MYGHAMTCTGWELLFRTLFPAELISTLAYHCKGLKGCAEKKQVLYYELPVVDFGLVVAVCKKKASDVHFLVRHTPSRFSNSIQGKA
jgi:hypothetical protein